MNTVRLAGLVGILLAGSAPALAGLEFEQTTLFVRTETGAPSVQGDFKFTNRGDGSIEILQSLTSCGCTTATLTKKTYAPGESGLITAIFKIGDREGRQSKTVLVRTDEPAANEYLLTLETEIVQELTIDPKLLSWKYADTAGAKSIAITYTSPGSLKLLAADDPSGAFEVEVLSASDARFDHVRIAPRSTAKGLAGQLRLQFETKGGKMIERFVVLRVLPEPNVVDAYRAPAAGR